MTIKTIKRKLEEARAKYAELKIIADGIHPRFKNKKADAENAAKEAKKEVKHWEDVLRLAETKEQHDNLLNQLPNAMIDKSLESQRNENYKNLIDNLNKEAKKHGFSNLWYWADSAKQRNLITDEQRLKCHTYKLVRDNDSHGGAGDFSPSERVIENLEKLLEILQNDDFQRKHHYPYHKMIYPPVKIEP